MANKRMYSKLKLVVIDQTEAWSDEIVNKAGKLSAVCLYDERVETHLMDLSPSYYLTPLYTITERQVDEDTHEEIVLNDDLTPFYLYCRGVDALKPMDLAKYKVNIRFTNSESESYRNNFEDAVEYFRGNHVI